MSKKVSAWALALNILIILTLIPVVQFNSARAQESSVTEEGGSFSGEAIAESSEGMAWSSEVPVLTAEQQTELKFWAENSNRPGPALPEEELTAPASGEALAADTASSGTWLNPKAPLAPGSAQLFRLTSPNAVIPANLKSNIMESSVGQGGKDVFFTGNWFAARSTNGGATWGYVSSFSGMADFCCDQVTIYDESRDTMYWLRMGRPTNSANRFLLGASSNGGATFCNYNFASSAVFPGEWWDYPHIQLGADYMYLTWNLFRGQPPNDSWARTVIMRLPLDSMSACAGFSWGGYQHPNWFTFVPVQGADHIMWFASNWPRFAPQNNRLAVWRWDEQSASPTGVAKTVAAWNATGRGSAICGPASGNWTGRLDQRLLTGARYMIHNTNFIVPGRNVIAWWWNARQGGNFLYPHIEAAAFFEDNLAQLPGNQGRPLIYNNVTCFAFPSVAANKRGDLGIVFNYGSSTTLRPNFGIGMADDFTGAPAPWTLYSVLGSNARPADNAWGDYNTTRVFMPSQDTWTGAVHYIPGGANCVNCSAPIFLNFGRSRDYRSWLRWQNK